MLIDFTNRKGQYSYIANIQVSSLTITFNNRTYEKMKHILLLLAALLLLCLAPLPYGFYQLVRFVIMVA